MTPIDPWRAEALLVERDAVLVERDAVLVEREAVSIELNAVSIDPWPSDAGPIDPVMDSTIEVGYSLDSAGVGQ